MNTDHVFQSKKEWMILLIRLGMPSIVVEKVLDIAPVTVYNYCMRMKAGRLPVLEDARPKMLKLYAYAKTHPTSSFARGGRAFRQALQPVLAEMLEEPRILQTLDCAMQGIHCFTEIRYTDDVPEGYRHLIHDLFGDYYLPPKPKELWDRYLKDVHESQVTLAPEQFHWEKQRHFVYGIISGYAEEARSYVAPLLTERIYIIIDLYASSPVIRGYYGLGCSPKTFEEIAAERGRSRERIRQIYNRDFAELKACMEKEIFPISNAWDWMQQMKVSHYAEIQDLQDVSNKKILELDLKYQGNTVDEKDIASTVTGSKYGHLLANRFLFEKISDMDLSVRAINCLVSADIRHIWQLIVRKENDLRKLRNFGKGSQCEVKEFLAKKGLMLGIEFTPAQLAYLKSKTTK